MSPAVRNSLAVVGGLAAGSVVIMLVQALNGVLFPPPPGFDPADPEQLAELMRQIPLGALLMVELSYVLGSLCAGMVVAKVGASRQMLLAFIVAIVLTLGGVANLVMIPHPLWFAIVSTLSYVPMALLGAYLLAPRE